MAKYRIEERPDFMMTSIGVESKGSNTDSVGLAAEEQAFEQEVVGNGTIDTLKQAAKNHYFSTANEPYSGKIVYYVGAQTSQDAPNTTRIIPFAEGTYLIVSALIGSPGELRSGLMNTAFGHVLREVEDYTHVEGLSAVVEMGVTNGEYMGEI